MKIRTDDIQIKNLQGYAGNLLTIDSLGNIISSSENFSNYITKSETASISAYLQYDLENNPILDIFRTEVVGISGYIQNQINVITTQDSSSP